MTDNRPEPRTEAGRRMLRRRSYWSGNDDIRAAILAIEAEAGAAPRAEGLQLGVAAVFQDHRQQGANACYCGWRPNIGEPSWEYHQHLMLKVLKVLGVRDE